MHSVLTKQKKKQKEKEKKKRKKEGRSMKKIFPIQYLL